MPIHRPTVALLLATTITVLCTPAAADERDRPRERTEDAALRVVRLCDASGCYYAHHVVDSDDDGVADADEIVAGSDPYDPRLRPTLREVVELIGAHALPSFEVGLGKVIVNPKDMQQHVEAWIGGDALQAAFPLEERKSALERLGVSTERMAAFGLDLERDGGAIVAMFESEDGPSFEKRVGGVQMSWISADDTKAETRPGWRAEKIELFDDGSKSIYHKNGFVTQDDGNGHGRVYDRDSKVVKSWYVNPDAEPVGGPPTEEEVKAWERMKDANRRVVQDGPEPIAFDPDDIVDPNVTIMLMDPDYVEFSGTVTSPVDYNEAQPRTVPNGLPDPQMPGGGCWPGCY